MKPILITLLFIMSSFIFSAQETPQQQFEKDLKNKHITLYILGGFAARHYPADADFQTKYKVYYHDFGCLAPIDLSFYKDYNILVLNHLKDTFNAEWQKDIRKDILAWEQWQKN